MRLMAAETRTLIDLLRDRAAAQGGECAYTFLDDGETPGAALTWSRLEERSRAIGAAVARRVEPGARVLVMFPPSIEFVPAFFGVLYAGAIAVPSYPPAGARADRTAARLRGMIADAGIALVLAPSASKCGDDLESLPWLGPAEVSDEEAEEWRAPRTTADSVAFLQYTSGSTSAPRGVMVSHGNLLHNLAQTHAEGRYGAGTISVSWLPVNHDMGLINGVLQPVFSGFPACLMAPAAFLQRPDRWLRAISRLGGTHSGGPNFAYDLCVRRVSDEDMTSIELGSWSVAYNGSEPVRRSTLEAFQQKFGACGFRWEAFSPAYGLAESTLLVSSVPAGVPPVMRGNAVSSGMPTRHSRVTIVDPATRTRLPDGAVGEIWVAGDSVASGYWNRPVDTAETFRAYTAGGEGPFLRTGDLGFVDGDGYLFVTGRIKDILIVRGVKHYPQDLELTAERAHTALRPGCCAAFAIDRDGEEKIAIVAEVETRSTDTDPSQIILAIRIAVAAAHHVTVASVALVPPGAIPKTTSGKLQRFLCREALMARSLKPLGMWSEGDAADAARVSEAPEERRRAS